MRNHFTNSSHHVGGRSRVVPFRPSTAIVRETAQYGGPRLAVTLSRISFGGSYRWAAAGLSRLRPPTRPEEICAATDAVTGTSPHDITGLQPRNPSPAGGTAAINRADQRRRRSGATSDPDPRPRKAITVPSEAAMVPGRTGSRVTSHEGQPEQTPVWPPPYGTTADLCTVRLAAAGGDR